jgi:hypothetical protein
VAKQKVGMLFINESLMPEIAVMVELITFAADDIFHSFLFLACSAVIS